MNEQQQLEASILGALLLFRDTHHKVIPVLDGDSFTIERNRLVYTAIKSLYDNNRPIDLVTVADSMNKNKTLAMIGGAYELTELSRSVGSGLNAEYHAHVLKEKQLRRNLEILAHHYSNCAHDESIDIFEMLDKLQSEVIQMGSVSATNKIVNMSMLVPEVLEQAEHAKKHKDVLLGIPTGFTNLDRITNGWKQPDLIIIAGRPAMGKTSFAVQCAINAADISNISVGLFSLEMSRHQIARKIMSNKAEIPASDIERGNFNDLSNTKRYCEKLGIYVNDTPGLSIMEFRSSARKMVKEYGCKMIVVDYLQLMTVDYRKGATRENEVSRISAALKATAKELEVPVIALSQLSRGVEGRGSKVPSLADLRESGAIEQDADIVIFLYRPEYYGIMEDEDGKNTDGMAKVIIAKHRNGPVDVVDVTFIQKWTKFINHTNAFEKF